VKVSNTRQLDKEARHILVASGALGVIAGLIDCHFGHDILALFGFAAGIVAVLLYPFRARNR